MSDMTGRNGALKQMLGERRCAMQDEVQRSLRERRTDRPTDGRDEMEVSDADNQRDLELALLQMRGEMLARVDEALARLDAGRYGSCVTCGADISERRLQALPFAVRCHACEETREQEQRREQHAARERDGFVPVSGTAASSPATPDRTPEVFRTEQTAMATGRYSE